jgi:hypothetical protein
MTEKVDPHLWLLKRIDEAEQKRARVYRETARDERLLWVLIGLLVLAPEIIWIARRLLK